MSIEFQERIDNRYHSVSGAVLLILILKFDCTPWLDNNMGFPLKLEGFSLKTGFLTILNALF